MIFTHTIDYDTSSSSTPILSDSSKTDLLNNLPKNASQLHYGVLDCKCLVDSIDYYGTTYNKADTIGIHSVDLPRFMRRGYVTLINPDDTLTSSLDSIECCATLFITETTMTNPQVTWTTSDGSQYTTSVVDNYTTSFQGDVKQVNLSGIAKGQLVLTIEL